MGRIKAVLFDFDGTLMDTNEIIIKSWQYAFNKINGSTCDRGTLIKTFGEPLEETMYNFFGGTREEVLANVEIYREYQYYHFKDDIQLFPGVLKMLEDLKSRGYMLAMVTSRLAFTTYQGIEKFGIEKFFDAVVTADDTDVHKPDPTPALIAMEKLGVMPENTVMVGDTAMDIGCASNAHVTSVLVGWSMALSESAAIEAVAPDHIVSSADGLTQLIESL